MSRRPFLALLLLALPACGGGSTPSSATVATATTTTLPPRLPPVPPVTRVIASGLERLDAFTLGTDQRLTATTRPALARGILSTEVVSGRFLYLSGLSGIEGYRIDPDTGALSALTGSPFVPRASAGSLLLDPRGRFLFSLTTGAATAFRIDATSGVLTAGPVSAVPVGSAAAFDPQGRFLFVIVQDSLAVSRVEETGALTAVAGSPFAGAAALRSTHPIAASALHVFVGTQGDGREEPALFVFRYDGATGAASLVSRQDAPSGFTPSAFALSSSGALLYVVQRPTLYFTVLEMAAADAYAVDLGAGTLQRVGTTNIGPSSFSKAALTSDGRTLLATLEADPFTLPVAGSRLVVVRADGAALTVVGTPSDIGPSPSRIHVFETQPTTR